jgi:nucleoside transporter
MSTSAPPAPAIQSRLSVMMFLQFFVWGAWYVSMTGWMTTEGVGLGELIGWAYTVGPIASCISPFFLGMVADRYFATQRVLAAMHFVGGAILLGVPAIAGSAGADAAMGFTHPYILALFAHMLFYMPTVGLTTTLSLANMTAPEKQFPIVRVWGTIGWIAAGIVVSRLPGGDKSPAQFWLAGGASILLALYSLTLPNTPPPGKGKAVSARELLGLDSLALMKSAPYAIFILCSFLICIPLAGYYNQARGFIASPAIGDTNSTFTMTYGQMSEILFMVTMPLFFRRLGIKWMLAVGMLAWVVRYGLFSFAANDHVMWMAIVAIVLHGICYDFFFVTGFLYVDRKAPRELRGQAQGFLVLVTQGLGLGLGAQVVARLLASNTSAEGLVDWQHFWGLLAAAALGVFLVFVALFRDKAAEQAE